LLLLREADERLGLTASLAERLSDPRDPNAVRYQLVELLRQRLYALAMGYSARGRRRSPGARSGHENGRLGPAG
jgi:hypothetical protein